MEQESLMPISPADTFRCYISPLNHGKEFIEQYLDIAPRRWPRSSWNGSDWGEKNEQAH